MQSNWKKTTITFIFANDQEQPVRIVLANGTADPKPDQIAAFGGYLASLTGLNYQHANQVTQNDIA